MCLWTIITISFCDLFCCSALNCWITVVYVPTINYTYIIQVYNKIYDIQIHPNCCKYSELSKYFIKLMKINSITRCVDFLMVNDNEPAMLSIDYLCTCAVLNIKNAALEHYIQYIPRNMQTVFALLCFVVVIHWLIFPYPSGFLHWHCGNLTIAPVPAKQPWWIWINTSCEFIMNDCITTTKQSTTKPCAYFLGYTV